MEHNLEEPSLGNREDVPHNSKDDDENDDHFVDDDHDDDVDDDDDDEHTDIAVLSLNLAMPWDSATPLCVWVPQFQRLLQLQNVFGLLEFDVFGDSWVFCNSDIVVLLTRMQAEGKAFNQMVVQEWLPTLPSITAFTA